MLDDDDEIGAMLDDEDEPGAGAADDELTTEDEEP